MFHFLPCSIIIISLWSLSPGELLGDVLADLPELVELDLRENDLQGTYYCNNTPTANQPFFHFSHLTYP